MAFQYFIVQMGDCLPTLSTHDPKILVELQFCGGYCGLREML